MGTLIDHTGQTFGRLTVVKRADNVGKQTAWVCVCECGNEVVVLGSLLRNGHSKSCGCYMRENSSNLNRTHGMSGTKLHKVWKNMKARCKYKSCDRYENYGGRGIQVCDEWASSFESFRAWSVNNGYHDGLTIERVDVNGDYEPSNCTWVTIKQQYLNRTDNRKITINGETKCLCEWLNLFSMNISTFYARVYRGWSDIKAITTPVRKMKKD